MKKLLVQKNGNKIFFVKSFEGEVIYTSAIDLENISIVGNCYVGKVLKIVKNSFAFVNIGEDKNGFINVNDKKEENIKGIKQGDDILVQVLRDENELKGASLTSEIVLKGEYIMAIHASTKQIGISKKITNTNVKKRLRKLGSSFSYSTIFRTEAEGVSKEAIINEYEKLALKLDELVLKGKYSVSPILVYKEENNSDIFSKIAELSVDCEKIIIENKDLYNELSDKEFSDKLLYEDTVDIFSTHFIKKQIDEIFFKKVWLKSGGFLIIEYTEAFVIIDVNSGKNIKEKNKEVLAIKTNKEAIDKLFSQIILRNLSGIILIDLIDMKLIENKEEIVSYAKEKVKNDTDFTIHGLTNLGILEITRKKRSEPIYKVLS